ncbi:PfkB family carbohydrate kinase [Aureimonas phyllosphaerae]|uniref:PfkB family carbohydrate kinase n=1 Tax=Aureimonas phyllosphaerae TaxID=1166078 RepID=UPI003A5BBFE2
MVDEALTDTGQRKPPSVLLLGAAHLDRIALSSTPFRRGFSNPGRVVERLGGAAFNAALALKLFGSAATLVSACGGDDVAERVGAELDRFDVVDGRIAWLDRRSATYTALVDAGGDLVGGVADMEIYDRLTPRVLSRRHLLDRIAEADGVLVDANLPPAALEQLASLRPQRLGAIAVSPAKITRLATIRPELSVLFASRVEIATLLSLHSDVGDADLVRSIRNGGLERAIVTDGPRSVLVVDADVALRQAPPMVAAVTDVVGAGDTLAGVAFGAWLDDRPFLDAVRLGLAAASLRISTGLAGSSAKDAAAIAASLPPPEFLQI